jgi:ornithine carbamoyltransferase
LRDRFGELSGLQIAYVGASDPVTHSLIEAATLSGVTVRVAAPPRLLPDPALLARAGSAVRVCETPREAVSGAAAVYGAAARRELPDSYTVTPELMSFATPGAVVMHAIPTARRRALSTDVFDGPRSVTSEQALNLLGVEQAVLRVLVTGDWEV